MSGKNPSASSLRAMPEISGARYQYVGRNPYAARIAREGIQLTRGRPTKKSHSPKQAAPISIRLTLPMRRFLEKIAAAQHSNVHAVVRQAILAYLHAFSRRRS